MVFTISYENPIKRVTHVFYKDDEIYIIKNDNPQDGVALFSPL